jgi:hypothetical protein
MATGHHPMANLMGHQDQQNPHGNGPRLGPLVRGGGEIEAHQDTAGFHTGETRRDRQHHRKALLHWGQRLGVGFLGQGHHHGLFIGVRQEK